MPPYLAQNFLNMMSVLRVFSPEMESLRIFFYLARTILVQSKHIDQCNDSSFHIVLGRKIPRK